jgi:hypothetical protein
MKGADDGGVGTNPSDGSLAAITDGSIIWTLPVETIEFGISNLNIFLAIPTTKT